MQARTRHARANPSTTQTNTALVPAVANRAVLLDSIYVSSDTAMTLTLVNGTTHDVIWRQYVGARGGATVPIGDMGAWGEGVDYTTSTDGSVFFDLRYKYTGE